MSESMVQVRNVTKVYERGKQKIEVLHDSRSISRAATSWR